MGEERSSIDASEAQKIRDDRDASRPHRCDAMSSNLFAFQSLRSASKTR